MDPLLLMPLGLYLNLEGIFAEVIAVMHPAPTTDPYRPIMPLSAWRDMPHRWLALHRHRICKSVCVGYQFDGGKSKKQTKIIAPQSNDHAYLKFLVKELDGLCGAALGFIVSEAITNTWYCNDSRLFGKSY
ncbi:hypothetical protein IFM89_014086 [Coptis chinensis]|uniref:Uncharacterized protein n=1 Tax=Coptis chinensis TaxID=261450 RepID=A0A835IWW4_9MAGN|nr:hypothetical protein IFM89_014086 [Coptis chinensis]